MRLQNEKNNLKNKNKKNKKWWTQLSESDNEEFLEAAKQGRVELIKDYLQWNNYYNWQHDFLNVQDKQGRTALILATMHNQKDLVQFLLAQPGINVVHKDKRGQSALYCANHQKNTDVADLLKSHKPKHSRRVTVPDEKSSVLGTHAKERPATAIRPVEAKKNHELAAAVSTPSLSSSSFSSPGPAPVKTGLGPDPSPVVVQKKKPKKPKKNTSQPLPPVSEIDTTLKQWEKLLAQVAESINDYRRAIDFAKVAGKGIVNKYKDKGAELSDIDYAALEKFIKDASARLIEVDISLKRITPLFIAITKLKSEQICSQVQNEKFDRLKNTWGIYLNDYAHLLKTFKADRQQLQTAWDDAIAYQNDQLEYLAHANTIHTDEVPPPAAIPRSPGRHSALSDVVQLSDDKNAHKKIVTLQKDIDRLGSTVSGFSTLVIAIKDLDQHVYQTSQQQQKKTFKYRN